MLMLSYQECEYRRLVAMVGLLEVIREHLLDMLKDDPEAEIEIVTRYRQHLEGLLTAYRESARQASAQIEMIQNLIN